MAYTDRMARQVLLGVGVAAAAVVATALIVRAFAAEPEEDDGLSDYEDPGRRSSVVWRPSFLAFMLGAVIQGLMAIGIDRGRRRLVSAVGAVRSWRAPTVRASRWQATLH